MRTETVTIPKLEFVPIPDSITEYCLVPMPPQDEDGRIRYKDVPAWTVEVLGMLEDCNIKLESIENLSSSVTEEGGSSGLQ